MSKGSKSITAAIYHLKYALDYIGDFKRDNEGGVKYQAGQWENKCSHLLNNIYSSLTLESKKLFEEEISKGDVLYLNSVSEMLMRMKPEQREFVEMICVNVLSGEKIIAEGDEGVRVEIN